MFPFILPPLWPAPTLLSSPSFPPISPSLPSHPPLFFITPSFSEWAALGLLGLVEVYQKHVWRFGGGWWEVLRQAAALSFLPKSMSQWGRKTLSEFKDRNLLAFYRILFSTEWINRKKLLTLKHSLLNTGASWKAGSFSLLSARRSAAASPAFRLGFSGLLSLFDLIPYESGCKLHQAHDMWGVWIKSLVARQCRNK